MRHLYLVTLAAASFAIATSVGAVTLTQVDFDKNYDFIGADKIYGVEPTTGSSVTGNQGTGIAFDLESTGNDIWTSNGGSPNYTDNVGAQSLTVETSLQNVQTVHTLMNLWWGSTALGKTSVSFFGTNGASQVFDLTGGVEIRDYNQTSAYPNSTSSGMTQTWWESGNATQRLDVVSFDIGSIFDGETLTSIVFTDTGAQGSHRAFVAGITAEVTSIPSSVPVPASLSLLLLGMGGITALRRKKSVV